MSSPAWWVAAGVVCLPCVDTASWCVNCAAGPAALSTCCLLSLAVSAALRPSPSCSIPFPSASRIGPLTPATPLRVMMTAMVTMVTVRLRVVCAVLVLVLSCCCCNSVCVTAAGGGNDSHTISSTPEGSRGTTTPGSTGLGSGAGQSQGASGVEGPQG
ncbi:hypothetical protein TcCL_Unassigned03539 [Trypanosoma cruzi]|nr:hypothetical protein TcCL_Unassigned03539 [Trypanosoma cruzi]